MKADRNRLKALALAGAGVAGLAAVDPALAQDTAAEAVDAATVTGVPVETQYIFNTLSFFLHGALVMWMAAGFAMLEAGLVRSKNVAMQCLKNVSLYSVAGIMYYLIGHNLMYDGVDGGWIGSFSVWSGEAAGEATPEDGGYAAGSDWFFQMVFVATAASIVSGTIAERTKIWTFLVFVVFLTGFIYPISGSWQWGGGWLAEMGFSDFAGSTLVHSVGGYAALTGALIIGARKGKYGPDGTINAMPGSSMPLATLGTFILWLGWFGFNGGSQLALGTGADASSIARIYLNTNLAAAGGVLAAMAVSQMRFGKIDLSMALNGAIGGLVSITAEPLMPAPWLAILIGGVGGVLVVYAVTFIDSLKIDDVVGAIAAHLVCGIWGTIAVPISNPDTSFVTQAIGISAYGVWTVVTSAIVWYAIKATMGLRVPDEEEEMGLDRTELGTEAYPEFGIGSQRI